MRKQRDIEGKEAPLEDPANLERRHLDFRIRAFSHCISLCCHGDGITGVCGRLLQTFIVRLGPQRWILNQKNKWLYR